VSLTVGGIFSQTQHLKQKKQIPNINVSCRRWIRDYDPSCYRMRHVHS